MAFETIASPLAAKRIVLSLSGREKSGKTHWALAGAIECAMADGKPVFHICLDSNGPAVAGKLSRLYGFPINIAAYDRDGSTRDQHEALWKEVVSDMAKALAACAAGGYVILDTVTELWETLRLARFGKLSQVMPVRYDALNAEMRLLVRDVMNSQATVIFLNRFRDVYVNDKATGDEEPSTWKPLPYSAQANAEMAMTVGKDGPEFSILFRNCAPDMTLSGRSFPAGAMTLPVLLERCWR